MPWRASTLLELGRRPAVEISKSRFPIFSAEIGYFWNFSSGRSTRRYFSSAPQTETCLLAGFGDDEDGARDHMVKLHCMAACDGCVTTWLRSQMGEPVVRCFL